MDSNVMKEKNIGTIIIDFRDSKPAIRLTGDASLEENRKIGLLEKTTLVDRIHQEKQDQPISSSPFSMLPEIIKNPFGKRSTTLRIPFHKIWVEIDKPDAIKTSSNALLTYIKYWDADAKEEKRIAEVHDFTVRDDWFPYELWFDPSQILDYQPQNWQAEQETTVVTVRFYTQARQDGPIDMDIYHISLEFHKAPALPEATLTLKPTIAAGISYAKEFTEIGVLKLTNRAACLCAKPLIYNARMTCEALQSSIPLPPEIVTFAHPQNNLADLDEPQTVSESTNFKLTRQSFMELRRRQYSDELMRKLTRLEQITYVNEDEFRKALQQRANLCAEEIDQYYTEILAQAERQMPENHSELKPELSPYITHLPKSILNPGETVRIGDAAQPGIPIYLDLRLVDNPREYADYQIKIYLNYFADWASGKSWSEPPCSETLRISQDKRRTTLQVELLDGVGRPLEDEMLLPVTWQPHDHAGDVLCFAMRLSNASENARGAIYINNFELSVEIASDSESSIILNDHQAAIADLFIADVSVSSLDAMHRYYKGAIKSLPACYCLEDGLLMLSETAYMELREDLQHRQIAERSLTALKALCNRLIPKHQLEQMLQETIDRRCYTQYADAILPYFVEAGGAKMLQLKLLLNKIQDIPQDHARLRFQITFDYLESEEPLSSAVSVAERVQEAFALPEHQSDILAPTPYELHLQITTAPKSEWLAIDLGTSAIAVKYAAESMDWKDSSLCDVQKILAKYTSTEFYKKEEIAEYGTPFLSSMVMLRPKGSLHGHDYEYDLSILSPNYSSIVDAKYPPIPHLKALIGMEYLPDPHSRFNDYQYRCGAGNKLQLTRESFKDLQSVIQRKEILEQLEPLQNQIFEIESEFRNAITEKIGEEDCNLYYKDILASVSLISFQENPLTVENILQATYRILLRDFINPSLPSSHTPLKVRQQTQPLIICIPNMFTPQHRNWISDALLGDDLIREQLYLQRDQILFLSESDAVASYYLMRWDFLNRGREGKERFQRPGGMEYVLVYDMGAGTLDLTYLSIEKRSAGEDYQADRHVKIRGHIGNPLAGNYFDFLIAQYIDERIHDRFELSTERGTMQKLQQAGLPDEILQKLPPLQDRIFNGKDNFLKALQDLVADVASHSEQILTYSRFEPDVSIFASDDESNATELWFRRLLKVYIRDQIKPNLDQDILIAFPQNPFKGFYPQGREIDPKDEVLAINTKELRTSKQVKTFIKKNTTDIFERFFRQYQASDNTIASDPGHFPLDTIVFSGRSTQFRQLHAEIMTELERWRDKTRGRLHSVIFQETTHERNPLKSAVVHGALRYATNYRGKYTPVTFETPNIQATYGILFTDPETGKWAFKKLLYPG